MFHYLWAAYNVMRHLNRSDIFLAVASVIKQQTKIEICGGSVGQHLNLDEMTSNIHYMTFSRKCTFGLLLQDVFIWL